MKKQNLRKLTLSKETLKTLRLKTQVKTGQPGGDDFSNCPFGSCVKLSDRCTQASMCCLSPK